LVVLAHFKALGHVINSFNHLVKVSGTVQIDISQRIFVGVEYAIEAFAFWVKNVSVESEAMAQMVGCTKFKLATKSKARKLFISIIELEDVTD